MVINRQGNSVLVGASAIFTRGTDFVGFAIIKIKENFGPDVESVESEDSIFIRMIGSSNTVASNILLAGRNVGNHITMVGNSLDFADIVDDSAGKVEISDSGAAVSVEMDTFLVNYVAHRSVESSEGSESAAETVANEVEIVVGVHVDGLLNSTQEVVLNVFLVVVAEISTANSVFNGVHIVFDGSGIGDFLN